MQFNKQRVARWSVALAAIVVAGVIPATAGGNGNGNGRGRDKTTSDDSYTTEHTGDINPTNVSIVSTDLALATVSISYDQMQSMEAHEIATGRGVVVAVLDGGFNIDHPDIAANMAPGFDAIDMDHDVNDFGDGVDQDRDGQTDRAVGHGTFVSGLILAAAPDATIVPIRVRDDEGLGTNEALIAGMEYAISVGADVINLSLEQARTKDQGMTDVLNEIYARGITMVVSAGNDGRETTPKLSWYVDTLCVGAVDSSDRIADFSNYITGSSWAPRMIFAPGVDRYGPLGYDDHGCWSGTSFAAGYISGAAALVRELHPDWGVGQVTGAVVESVDPVWTADGTMLEHSGRVNLLQVVSR